jgi:hypothetical protein
MGYVAAHGYVRIKVGKDHPLADVSGYAYEHRLVAARVLGRPLTRQEIVHHLNGVKNDNRPENLEVHSSRWSHNAEHRVLPTPRQSPGQSNERLPCACGCGETLWRFNAQHIEVRFISGHNGRLNRKIRPPGPGTGSWNRAKTHCPKGHPYDEANTRVKGNRRVCRECHRKTANLHRRANRGVQK